MPDGIYLGRSQIPGAVAPYSRVFDVRRKTLQSLWITMKEVWWRWHDDGILLLSIDVEMSSTHGRCYHDLPTLEAVNERHDESIIRSKLE